MRRKSGATLDKWLLQGLKGRAANSVIIVIPNGILKNKKSGIRFLPVVPRLEGVLTYKHTHFK